MRTIVGLASSLGVIYGLYWVLKQVKASREDERATGQGLAPLATLPLGANRSLHLVRAGREVVLSASASSGVTPIRTYTRGRGPRARPARREDDSRPPRGRPTAALERRRRRCATLRRSPTLRRTTVLK